MQRVVESARRLTGAQQAVLMVKEPDWNVREVGSLGVSAQQAEDLVESAELLKRLDRSLDARRPVRANSLHAVVEGLPPPHLLTSLLAIPVQLGKTSYGQLYLLNKVDGGEFSTSDEDLGVCLAQTAASAVENTLLLRQQYRRHQWFEGMSDMTRELLREVDLEAATQSAAQRIRDISGADYAAVVLADPGDQDNLVYQAGSGLDVRPRRGEHLPRKGLAGMAVDTGQAIVTPDLTTDPRYSPSPHRRKHLSVLGLTMFLPLNAEDEVLGTFLVSWRRDSTSAHLAAREIDLMQTFANQTALALQRVRTQENQRRRERWLQAASQMAQLLLGEIDRDEAMRLVVRRLREISGADIAGVMLVDRLDPTSMYVVVFEGINDAYIPPDTRIPRAGLVARVLETRQRIVSDDYPHLTDHQAPPEWSEPLSQIGLGMQIPLIADREPLGTLFAGWHRGSPHAPAARADAEQVTTFADLAALALQRARTQGDRERLMLLEERDRIAHDIRDVVLQRLFAIGLRLHTMRDMSTEPAIQQRVRQAIDDLDSTNQQIRSTLVRTPQDESPDSADPFS